MIKNMSIYHEQIEQEVICFKCKKKFKSKVGLNEDKNKIPCESCWIKILLESNKK